jgi:hypothetical protein
MRSSWRAVLKMRSSLTSGCMNWLATIPCAPGGQPVTRLEIATRVSLGKMLRLLTKSDPSARNRLRLGIVS